MAQASDGRFEEIETLVVSDRSQASPDESLGYEPQTSLLIETIDVNSDVKLDDPPSDDPTAAIDATSSHLPETDKNSPRFENAPTATPNEAVDKTEPFVDSEETAAFTSRSASQTREAQTEIAPTGEARGSAEVETLAIATLSLDSGHGQGTSSYTGDPIGPGGLRSGVISRFHIIRPHAKGGLGEVFLALDQELNREVALKQIQDRHADDSISRSRFMIEAEVTGCLEHPGIVPVYSLGRYRDGRPYYAMRFIRGDSLKKSISRFHQAERPDRDPGQRSLEFRNLLSRFLDVCDSIDYAHSRGILHRDIKPDNVMLGNHGETLVVDWGLAKALGKSEAPEAVPLIPLASSGTTATLHGSTIGTPQFMSPEQANGELDRLGPPSDVYSLGATLYQILVGKIPFSGQNLRELLKNVREGCFPRPREVKLEVPAPLEAICLKAMSLQIEDRYQTARSLAEDVESWLADEPVSAWTEPWNVRLERWAKRHKTAVVAFTVLAATTIIGLSIGTVLISREQERTAVNFRMARSAADDLLTQVGSIDLADLPQMETVRLALLQRARAYYERFLVDNRGTLTIQAETLRARARLGEIKAIMGDVKGAEKDFDATIAPLRRLLSDSPRDVELLKDLGRAHVQFGILLKRAGRLRDSEASLVEGVRLREAVQKFEPKSEEARAAVVDARYQLASLLRRRGGTRTEVKKAYDLAIQDQKSHIDETPTDAASASEQARYLNNLGILQSDVDPVAATEAFLKSLKITADLLARTETVPNLHWRFARSSNNIGQLDQARKDFGVAIQDFETARAHLAWLIANYPAIPDYRAEHAAVLISLANVESDMGQWESAEKHFEEALKALVFLIKRYPDLVDYRLRLADAWLGEGISLSFAPSKEGKPVASSGRAAEAFERAIVILEKLVADQPDAPEYRDRLAAVYENLANLRIRQHDWKGGLSAIQKAIRLQKSTRTDDPANRNYSLAQANHLAVLARIDLTEKRNDDLLKDAEDILGLGADGPEPYLVAAECVALRIGNLSDDRSIPKADRERSRARLSTLGGRLIAAAVDHDRDERMCLDGQGDPKLNLDDSKFDSIRDAESFKNARAKLEKRQEARKTRRDVREG